MRKRITDILLMDPPRLRHAPIQEPPAVVIYNIASEHRAGALYEFIPKITTEDHPAPPITIYDATVNGKPIITTMTVSKAAMRVIDELIRTFYPEATLQANLDQLHPIKLDHLSTTTQDGVTKIEIFAPVIITPEVEGVIILKLQE